MAWIQGTACQQTNIRIQYSVIRFPCTLLLVIASKNGMRSSVYVH